MLCVTVNDYLKCQILVLFDSEVHNRIYNNTEWNKLIENDEKNGVELIVKFEYVQLKLL